MSYNSSTGIITPPVSLNDVQRACSLYNRDLGTLITNASINKWAKYKPVKRASVNIQEGQFDFTNNCWLSTSYWWKANDGLCGFSTQVATEFGNSLTTQGTFMYNLINGLLGWTYDKPVGGTNSPFRIEDFAQYNKHCIEPYGAIATTKIYIDTYGDAQIDWEIVEVGDDNIRLTDISVNGYSLSEFYLGLILWSGSTFYLYTSSSTFAAGGTLSITLENAPEGTWNCMPFFTLHQVNSGGTFDSNGLFVSMADTTPLSITLTTQGTNYIEMPDAEWNSAETAVTFSVELVNETSSSHVYSSLLVTIYGNSPTTGTALASKTFSNISVPANSTYTVTGTIYITKSSSYSAYYIVVADKTSGSTISSKYNQIEEYSGM